MWGCFSCAQRMLSTRILQCLLHPCGCKVRTDRNSFFNSHHSSAKLRPSAIVIPLCTSLHPQSSQRCTSSDACESIWLFKRCCFSTERFLSPRVHLSIAGRDNILSIHSLCRVYPQHFEAGYMHFEGQSAPRLVFIFPILCRSVRVFARLRMCQKKP